MPINTTVLSQLQNKTLVEAHTFLLDQGIQASEVGYYIGEFLREKTGKGKRTFNYTTSFPAQEPQCVTQFDPKFVHQDWVDGEDVVQAGETPNEKGFNERFHSIEDDFEAVKADLARIYTCVGNMRASVRALLDEVRLELNRLNSDIDDLRGQTTKPTFPNLPTDVFIDPDIKRKLLGVSQFENKEYLVYEIDDKYEMLPLVRNITLPPSDPLDDPRVVNPGILGELIEDMPEFKDLWDDERAVTPADIAERYGHLVLENGISVRDAIRVLPPQETFASPEALIDRMTDLNAALIRSTEGVEGFTSRLGVEAGNIGTITLGTISTNTSLTNSLSTIGVSTVGDLQNTTINDLSLRLSDAGITSVSSGELGRLISVGTVLGRLR